MHNLLLCDIDNAVCVRVTKDRGYLLTGFVQVKSNHCLPRVRCLLDCASYNTYIAANLAKALNLIPKSKKLLAVQVFGGETNISQYRVVELLLTIRENDMPICALVVPREIFLVATLQANVIAPLADAGSPRSSKCSHEVQLLLRSFDCFKIVSRGEIKMV